MKKLNLKNLKLEANDLLQRNELKKVLGGGYPMGIGCGQWSGNCPPGLTCCINSGSTEGECYLYGC